MESKRFFNVTKQLKNNETLQISYDMIDVGLKPNLNHLSRLTSMALKCKTLVTKTKEALKKVRYEKCPLDTKLLGRLG